MTNQNVHEIPTYKNGYPIYRCRSEVWYEGILHHIGNKVKGLLHNFARRFTFSRNISQGKTDLKATKKADCDLEAGTSGTTGAGSVTAGNNDNTQTLLGVVSPLSPEDRDSEKRIEDLYGFLYQRRSDIMAGYYGNLMIAVGFTGFLHFVPLICRVVPLLVILAGASGIATLYLGVLSWFEMRDVHNGLKDAIQESKVSMPVLSFQKMLLLRNDSMFKMSTIEIASLTIFSFYFAVLVCLSVSTRCR